MRVMRSPVDKVAVDLDAVDDPGPWQCAGKLQRLWGRAGDHGADLPGDERNTDGGGPCTGECQHRLGHGQEAAGLDRSGLNLVNGRPVDAGGEQRLQPVQQPVHLSTCNPTVEGVSTVGENHVLRMMTKSETEAWMPMTICTKVSGSTCKPAHAI